MGTTETKKMRVGVVGCGAISDIYLTNMIHNFENLEVAACCAGHLEHAKKKAEQYGIDVYKRQVLPLYVSRKVFLIMENGVLDVC